MNKWSVFLIIILFFIVEAAYALPFYPQAGDFIFQNLSSNFASGVSGATNSPWAHVGIIDKKNGQLIVIEANFSGVIETPLDTFIRRCKNRYAVVRLALPSEVISRLLLRARGHLGKPYDYLFRINEVDTIYCSELIFDALNHVLDLSNPIKPKPMDFSGAIEYWNRYFLRHGSDVPQGKPGVSPHDIFTMTGGILIFHYEKSQLNFNKLYDPRLDEQSRSSSK